MTPRYTTRARRVSSRSRAGGDLRDHPCDDLRAVLLVVVSNTPTRHAIRALVDRCHRIAAAYLRHRQRTGHLHRDLLTEPVGDLAFDALGDLFARDAHGRFMELRGYFATGDERAAEEVRAATEATLERRLRGLVLSAVSDWLFATYRTADRSLARLIRRLKRVAGEMGGARLERRGRTLWVVAAGEEDGGGGHLLPPETLEARVAGAVAASTCTRDLLEAALCALRRGSGCQAAYPLTGLAQVLRAAETRVGAATAATEVYPTTTTSGEAEGRAARAPLLRPEEARGLIAQSVEAVRAAKAAHYVQRQGLDAQAYQAYFAAIADRLRAQFVPPGDPELTQQAALERHLGCGRAAYRAEHRAQLEYLARLTRTHFVELVRAATQVRPTM